MHIHVPAEFATAVRASWGGPETDINFSHSGRYIIFDIDGPLAMPWVTDELRADVNAILNDGRHNLILDLADVPYIDSAGVGLLVAINRLIHEAGGRLVLLSAQGRIRETLKRLRLDQFFECSEDSTLEFTRS